MLKKLWPTAAGILVFFGSVVLFSSSILKSIFWGLQEYLYVVWLVSICLAGLTIGWQTKGKALLLNVVLSLIFFIIWGVLLAIPAALVSPTLNINRLLLITLLVIPSSFLGEKLYWRLRK